MSPHPLTESDYWVALEFRLCDEFARLPERRCRRLWCDGFIPHEYILNGPSPRVTGGVWMCDGPAQEPWEFSLLLRRSYASREEIEWSALLPPDGVTRWMSFDQKRRFLEIDPAVAIPDLPS